MSALYHSGSRFLQDRFDTRRLADRLEAVKVHATFTAEDRDFIERLDFFILATADEGGRPSCSYKGGDPGFVRVADATTLVFPSYDGNGMFLSMGNVLTNPAVGLLFLDLERQRRLRVEGTAELRLEPELLSVWPGAQCVVRVSAERIYPNCPRYIHHYQRVERSAFVPRADAAPPVPAWKRAEWARDVLPAGDPAREAPLPAPPAPAG
jgi:uncharacterized protein